MTQPAVNVTELDGSLGVLPDSAGRLLALAGVSSTGPVDTPSTWARITDIVATFGEGPLVEAAAFYIRRYGRPVVLIRTGQTVAGSEGVLDDADFAGTSVVTLGSENANDDLEIEILFGAGGTIGVAGITYQYSLDGGRTRSPVTALGVANTILVPGSGGVNFDFAAGTVVAGDILRTRTFAPNWNGAEITAALAALEASILNWELVHVVGAMDGTAFDAVDLAVSGMAAKGKYHGWIGHFRMPNVAETEAQYKTAFDTAFSAKATVHGMVCAGAEKLTSAVSGRKYRRPVSFPVAAREAASSEEVNTADVNLGPLQGVSIRDANGNPDEHDESVNPGLDDSRACVLRTWDGIQGVYINRPRLLSPAGSDFQLMPHRRVINLAHAALRAYFIRRLNKPVLVNAATGFILETEAREIEAGARAVLRAVLLAKPKASGIQFTLSRTDNLLSTKTMHGTARIVPLAYPEQIDLEVGFSNPALELVAA